MKKLVLGCVGVFVILAIAGGVAGYFFVYKPARSLMASLSEFKEIPAIEAKVENKAAFTAPETGELTEEQVTRFVAVQTALKDRLGARMKELDAKYDALNNEKGANASIAEGLGALQDLGGLVLDAKRVQVEALNAQHFSLAEYEWARTAAYQAAGVPLSLDFEQIIKNAQAGQVPTQESMTEAVAGNVPERNKQLIAPHAEALRESAGLAFFGL